MSIGKLCPAQEDEIRLAWNSFIRKPMAKTLTGWHRYVAGYYGMHLDLIGFRAGYAKAKGWK